MRRKKMQILGEVYGGQTDLMKKVHDYLISKKISLDDVVSIHVERVQEKESGYYKATIISR